MNSRDLGALEPIDYGQLPNTTLIALLKIYLLLAVRCALKILLKTTAENEEIWRDSQVIALDPSITNAARLFDLHPDAKPIVYLVDLKLKRNDIEQEIERRLETHGFSRELLRLEDKMYSDDWTAPLLEQLGPGGRVFYKPWQEDPEDVVMEAVDRAIEFHVTLSEQYKMTQAHKKPPPLPAELGFPVDDPPPWDKWIPQWFYCEVHTLLRRLTPALDGTLDAEGKAEMVRAIQTHTRRMRRHRARRSFTTVEEHESQGDIVSDSPGILQQPEDRFIQKQREDKLSQALKELCERRGPKAREYIESLLLSGRKGEAAEEAEIDPKTGKSYLTEFTILVQDTDPPKIGKRKAAKKSRSNKK